MACEDSVERRTRRPIGFFVRLEHEAVSRVVERPNELVFMDLQMPSRDGNAATRTLRAMETGAHLGEGCESMTIVALSASQEPEVVSRGRAAGMDGHLALPFREAELQRSLFVLSFPHAMDSAASERRG